MIVYVIDTQFVVVVGFIVTFLLHEDDACNPIKNKYLEDGDGSTVKIPNRYQVKTLEDFVFIYVRRNEAPILAKISGSSLQISYFVSLPSSPIHNAVSL